MVIEYRYLVHISFHKTVLSLLGNIMAIDYLGHTSFHKFCCWYNSANVDSTHDVSYVCVVVLVV